MKKYILLIGVAWSLFGMNIPAHAAFPDEPLLEERPSSPASQHSFFMEIRISPRYSEDFPDLCNKKIGYMKWEPDFSIPLGQQLVTDLQEPHVRQKIFQKLGIPLAAPYHIQFQYFYYQQGAHDITGFSTRHQPECLNQPPAELGMSSVAENKEPQTCILLSLPSDIENSVPQLIPY